MTQVLFAGNLAAYGTLTPAFLQEMAAQGVEPLLLTRYFDFPSDYYAQAFDPNAMRLTTPLRTDEINPNVVHAIFGKEMPECQLMFGLDNLVKKYPNAKFLVSIDGVATDRIVLEKTLPRANAVAVPHRSIVDAFSNSGSDSLYNAISVFDGDSRLHEVRPGIDTKRFDPSTDRALVSRREGSHSSYNYSHLPPYNSKGEYNLKNPSAKKSLNSVISDEHGLRHTRDTYVIFYGPDVSDNANLAEVSAQRFVHESIPRFGENLFFVGTERGCPAVIKDLGERVLKYRETRHVAYVSYSDSPAYRRMLGGAFMGLFPPEAGEFGFASVPYVQRLMEAMRYGVITAVAPAFERQGIAVPYGIGLSNGNAFVAAANDEAAFDAATNLSHREAFQYINGNHRYSEIVPSAMQVECGVGATVARYRYIYDSLFAE